MGPCQKIELLGVLVKPWGHPPFVTHKYHASCLLLMALRRRWIELSHAHCVLETIKHTHLLQISFDLFNKIAESQIIGFFFFFLASG